MSIAQKLSWELVALNEIHPSGFTYQRAALEIAYGVALGVSDQGELFSAILSRVIEQSTDERLKQALRIAVARGLKQ